MPWAEAGWERSVEAPPLDEAAVRARLARFSPALASRPLSVLGGGLRALVVRVGDDLVLRLATAPEHDLRREAALLRLVASDVRVPRAVDGDERALLLEFVPHEELPATEEVARRVGRAAARIHARRFPASGFLDADLRVAEAFPSAHEGLAGWARGCLAGHAGRRLGDLAPRVAALWDAHAPALLAACAEPRLVHADFKPANLKWVPREREVVVLDWEFSWAGPPLMDLGQFLRWGVPPAFERAMVEAYRAEGGTAPDDWRRTGELLDLFNLVGLLDHEEPRPLRDRDLLARVRRTLGD